MLSLLARRSDAAAGARRWRRQAIWLPMAASLAVAAVGALLLTMPRRIADAPVAPPAPSRQPIRPPAVATPAPPPASPQPGARPNPAPPETADLVRRRGAIRQIGGKTFRLVAGEWLDSSYDPGALLPVVDVTSDESRRAAFLRMPALEAYATLGDRVTVVYEGSAYRFAPP